MSVDLMISSLVETAAALKVIGLLLLAVYIWSGIWLGMDADFRKQPVGPWVAAYILYPAPVLVAYLFLVRKLGQAQA